MINNRYNFFVPYVVFSSEKNYNRSLYSSKEILFFLHNCYSQYCYSIFNVNIFMHYKYRFFVYMVKIGNTIAIFNWLKLGNYKIKLVKKLNNPVLWSTGNYFKIYYEQHANVKLFTFSRK